MRKLIISLISFGILAGFAAVFWLLMMYPKQSTLETQVEVTIARGSGGIAIANKLTKMGVIEYPHAFRALAQIQGIAGRFQAGEYVFEAGTTPAGVMDKLSNGDIILRQVTIPEGKTSAEIVEIINQAPELDGSLEGLPKEGSLLPNTYRYTKGETRQSIVDRMQKANQEVIEKLWPARVEGLPFKTKQEALTLASIVEKETGVAHERTHVAGLYINRLHKGMLLQADPTVSYGIHGGQSGVRSLTYRDLKKPNKYNTYLNVGLPPGPICNPGKQAIAAVLNPAQHDDLYMVATGTGGHYFAKNNKGHLKNVKKYRKWQKAQRAKAKK
ncbi:MAG: endolytic transglycosylase MltG [Rickettsiales bacterium]|nr:endolytic transglycosylase MltG [Rickettsiales bacterium]